MKLYRSCLKIPVLVLSSSRRQNSRASGNPAIKPENSNTIGILYSVLYVFVLLFQPSYANERPDLINCGKDVFYSDEETVEKIVPFEEYILTLRSLEVNDTKGLFDLKENGWLPPGVPGDPVKSYNELQIYPDRNENMKILWKIVRRFQDWGQEDTAGRRKMTKKERQLFVREVQDFLENEAAGIVDEDESEGEGIIGEDEDEEIGSEEVGNGNEKIENEAGEVHNKDGKSADQKQTAAKTISQGYFRQRKRRQDIISLIRVNNKITAAEMAKKLGVSKQTIDSDIREFERDLNNVQKVRLIRIGSSLNGHWHIVEKGVKYSIKDFYEQRKKKILFLMWKKSKIKRDELAKELGVSSPTISNIIRELKDEGRLDKEGRTWLPLLTKEEEEEFEARRLKLFE